MKTPKNKLFSIKISAGSRTYCFDVKTSVDGIKYLVIKELRDEIKKGQIMVFKEHIQEFRKGFRKAVRLMKKNRPKTYDIEQLRRIYPKAYVEWTDDEENKLMKLYAQNKTIRQIAKVLQRKASAIRSRLKKLDKRGLL